MGTASAIDSSIFWGYLLTQVPGGFLASKYPANLIFGTAIACSSFLNLLVPFALQYNATVLILIRVMQGLVEVTDVFSMLASCYEFRISGLHVSSMPWYLAILGSAFRKVPISNSRLLWNVCRGIFWHAFIWNSNQLDNMANTLYILWYTWALLVSAQVLMFSTCLMRVVSHIRYLGWLWLIFEKPCKHPTISARELLYIEQSLGQTANLTMPTIATTPWKAFFTSMPVYAIIVANFCRSWNFYLLVIFQASYMQTSFGLQTEKVLHQYFISNKYMHKILIAIC